MAADFIGYLRICLPLGDELCILLAKSLKAHAHRRTPANAKETAMLDQALMGELIVEVVRCGETSERGNR